MSEPIDSAPHGREIESVATVTVSDGNMRMSYPETASITRTADGVVVTNAGRTRMFSAAAVVTRNGYYRVFAPVTH